LTVLEDVVGGAEGGVIQNINNKGGSGDDTLHAEFDAIVSEEKWYETVVVYDEEAYAEPPHFALVQAWHIKTPPATTNGGGGSGSGNGGDQQQKPPAELVLERVQAIEVQPSSEPAFGQDFIKKNMKGLRSFFGVIICAAIAKLLRVGLAEIWKMIKGGSSAGAVGGRKQASNNAAAGAEAGGGEASKKGSRAAGVSGGGLKKRPSAKKNKNKT
jgi:hypothetical protein